MLQQIDDADARAATTAERTLLANLNGGCLAPIAAHGTIVSGQSDPATAAILHLQARVLSTDGSRQLRESDSCALDVSDQSSWPATARKLADQVSQRLGKLGAKELIRQAR
jgi:hydroxymethylbilane synthase